jgi:hypothetical protein
MISAIHSDTLQPRNLYDWELSDETTILPPSRPLAELTSVTYLIVKGRMMHALGHITDFHNAMEPRSYDKVRELDRTLEEAYRLLPPNMRLQTKGSETPASESASLVAALQMDFMYHQGMCTLHRRFLGKERHDPQYRLSLDRCISSALELLAQQDFLHRETRSTSRGSMPYWYNVSHARHFFVVATMILCIFMEFRRRGENTESIPDQKALLRALERSCEIWKDVQAYSDEVKRLYPILNGMLLSFQSPVTAGSPLRAERPEQEPASRSSATNEHETQLANGHTVVPEKYIASEMDIDWVCYLLS